MSGCWCGWEHMTNVAGSTAPSSYLSQWNQQELAQICCQVASFIARRWDNKTAVDHVHIVGSMARMKAVALSFSVAYSPCSFKVLTTLVITPDQSRIMKSVADVLVSVENEC